ncbi:MAG TPA: hypothetical protein VIL09_17680 [Microvirga sp.]
MAIDAVRQRLDQKRSPYRRMAIDAVRQRLGLRRPPDADAFAAL